MTSIHSYLALILLAAAANSGGIAAETGAAGAAPGVSSIAITLRNNSASKGEQVLLGEIAEISGASAESAEQLDRMSLGHAAPPGASRTFVAQEIDTALRQFDPILNFELRGAAEAKVTAEIQNVTGAEVARAAKTALSAEFRKIPDLDAEIEITSQPSDFLLRAAPYDFQIDPADLEARPGNHNIRVRVIQFGHRAAEVIAGLSAKVIATLNVASERINTGDILLESGIKSVRREVTAMELKERCDSSKFIGMRAKQSIAGDQVLLRGCFASPLAIKRGDAVQVVVRRGGLELSAAGEARNDASVGDTVHVFVASSNAEILARASGPHEASMDELSKP